nr:hypothetical protein HK105_004098 [Polyrhizophydium stewartii]
MPREADQLAAADEPAPAQAQTQTQTQTLSKAEQARKRFIGKQRAGAGVAGQSPASAAELGSIEDAALVPAGAGAGATGGKASLPGCR